MSQEFDVEEFRKRFPHLAGEILDNKTKQITLKVDKHLIDPWKGYIPTAIDYIRRCSTVKEAHEVINYLIKRGELKAEEGYEIMKIIETQGLEAFGGRKEDDYYYKEARKYWNMLKSRKRIFSP
ncbi:MAG: DUF2095 family protein [Desulfurococcaceae archaeon]